MIRLHLVRHGSTSWSEAGRFNGWTDVPLSDAGLGEARTLRAVLAGEEFAGVWTSDLARCRSTAEVAWGEASADRRLRELDFGSIEGRTYDELGAETRSALGDFESFVAPGGESVSTLWARLEGFLEELEPGDHLVFTHGGVIRALLRRYSRDRAIPPAGSVVVGIPAHSRGGPRAR